MTTLPPITNNPDIRFLGRLLGDVIRTYGGEALFKRIEHIRSTSVDRHRGVAGADTIDLGLDSLSLDDTIAFVRGFMMFSMLANLAEDRQGIAAEPGADVATAIEKLAGEGIGRDAVLALLDHALVGWRMVGHAPLFRLIETGDAHALFRHLCRHAILTRPFADRRDRLRIGLPPDGTALSRLTTALAEYRV